MITGYIRTMSFESLKDQLKISEYLIKLGFVVRFICVGIIEVWVK
jgi:hypothetical protein